MRAPLVRIAVSVISVAIFVLVGCGARAPRLGSPALADDEVAEYRDLGRESLDPDAPNAAHDEGRTEPDAADDRRADDRRLGDGRLDDRSDAGADDRRTDASTGPPVAAVVRAAWAAAGLGGSVPGHPAMRARLGGLVPWVSVRTGRDASWHDEAPDIGRGTTLEVRATWRLDRLMFDGRELQVVALDAARRRERRRLATYVIRTYFTWKRSASRSRAEEASAELDALTSGWFSETTRRAASEIRTVRTPATTP